MKLTVAQAQKNCDSIYADNERRLESIEKRIIERKEKNLKHDDLDAQLSQALTTARLSEERALKTLNDVKAAAAVEQAENASKARAASDAIVQKQKDKAFRAYIAEGGSAAAFDAAWPAIHEKMIEAAVLQETAVKERAPILRSL